MYIYIYITFIYITLEHFYSHDHHGAHNDIIGEIIDFCDPHDQEKRENFWIHKLRTLYPDGLSHILDSGQNFIDPNQNFVNLQNPPNSLKFLIRVSHTPMNPQTDATDITQELMQLTQIGRLKIYCSGPFSREFDQEQFKTIALINPFTRTEELIVPSSQPNPICR